MSTEITLMHGENWSQVASGKKKKSHTIFFFYGPHDLFSQPFS